MKNKYLSRKSKEFISLKCSELCLSGHPQITGLSKKTDPNVHYYEDELQRKEKACLVNCFHKTFRFLAHSNSIYTFLTADKELADDIIRNLDEGSSADYEEDEVTAIKTFKEMNVKDSEGETKIVPSRKQMEIIVKENQNLELLEKMKEEQIKKNFKI